MKGFIIIDQKGKKKNYPFNKLEYNLEAITRLSKDYFNSDFPCPKELAYVQNRLMLKLEHVCTNLPCRTYRKTEIPESITRIINIPKNTERIELWI